MENSFYSLYNLLYVELSFVLLLDIFVLSIMIMKVLFIAYIV